MLAGKFSGLPAAATIFAAVCHDVGHPGVTNAFRTAVADELAITYNDRSVNENMHAAMAYRTLQLQGCGAFAHLSKDQYNMIRKLAIDMILGTDMAAHFDNLKQLTSMLEEFGPDPQGWENSTPALQWILHTADICSTARPFATADSWTDRLLSEFFLQGDREQELGLPISPLCDRKTVCRTSSQLGFVNFIVKPSFEALTGICEVGHCLGHLGNYRRQAQEKEQSKQRASVGAA